MAGFTALAPPGMIRCTHCEEFISGRWHHCDWWDDHLQHTSHNLCDSCHRLLDTPAFTPPYPTPPTDHDLALIEAVMAELTKPLPMPDVFLVSLLEP